MSVSGTYPLSWGVGEKLGQGIGLSANVGKRSRAPKHSEKKMAAAEKRRGRHGAVRRSAAQTQKGPAEVR